MVGISGAYFFLCLFFTPQPEARRESKRKWAEMAPSNDRELELLISKLRKIQVRKVLGGA